MARADGDIGAGTLNDRPNLDGIYGSTANPLRLIHMMGLVWRLAQGGRTQRLDVLEIGSWGGSSALTWGEAIQHYCSGRGTLTCVDAWEPYLDIVVNADEANRQMNQALADGSVYDVFRSNMAFLPPGIALDIRKGRSADILPRLPRAAFDLVYIDGDHTYAAVAADIDNAMPLVREGGIICGDDLELQAHECRPTLDHAAALEKGVDEVTHTIFHPGVTRAVAERFGKVSCWHGLWAMQRRGTGWDMVSLAGMPARIPAHIPAPSLIGLKAALMKSGII